jgi:hypothetical protein
VDQILLLAILEIWGKWFMNFIIGGCDQLNHPYQSNIGDFNGKYERRQAPPIMIGVDVLEHAEVYDSWKVNGGREEGNPTAKTRVKQRNSLFDLPYWKVNSII